MDSSRGISSHLTVQFAYLVFSLAVLSMKYASGFPFASVLFMKYYLLSLVFMVTYACFWQRVLAIYPLTRAYSWKALVFIWVFIFSVLLFREPVTWKNIVGTIMIVTGAIMVNGHE